MLQLSLLNVQNFKDIEFRDLKIDSFKKLYYNYDVSYFKKFFAKSENLLIKPGVYVIEINMMRLQKLKKVNYFRNV
jgi:hypothetical protein